MKHPITIEKYNGTLDELARDVVSLRYDVLAKFLNEMIYNIVMDAKKDSEAKRPLVATMLFDIASRLHFAKKRVEELWDDM